MQIEYMLRFTTSPYVCRMRGLACCIAVNVTTEPAQWHFPRALCFVLYAVAQYVSLGGWL